MVYEVNVMRTLYKISVVTSKCYCMTPVFISVITFLKSLELQLSEMISS